MKCLDFSIKIRFSSGFAAALRLLSIMLLFCAIPLQAVEVRDIFQGSVVVDSRSSERERDRAFSEAFRQVLVKVTGSTQIFNQPLVRRAMNNADDYVDTWSYRAVRRPAVGGDSVSSEELSVTFFEPEVLALLDAARIPLWPGNRPYTLVWLVVQDELGDRELVGSSTGTYPGIIALLEQSARDRGLPLLVPVLDIEDLRTISTDDVWNMDEDRLLQASQRYQSESILAIRLYRTLGGDVFGKSSYLFRGQVLELEAYEEPPREFLEESIALATEELSAYYAVLLSGTDSNIEVRLTVLGVDSAEDYAGLLDYVNELTDVNAYQIASVKGDAIELTLSTGGQLRQLVETIALNRSLEPSGELVREDNRVFMTYQWNR